MIERILFLLALAVVGVRLTRLLVVDEFPPVRALREWFVRTFAAVDRFGNVIRDRERWGRLAGLAYSVAYVWTCPWCMSVWVAAAVWGVADWRMSVPWPVVLIALTSMLAGWDANLQGEHDKRWEIMDRKLKGHEIDVQ